MQQWKNKDKCFAPLNFNVFFYELGKNTLAFVNNVLLKPFFFSILPMKWMNEDLSVLFFPSSQLVMQLKIVLNLWKNIILSI